MFSGRVPEPPSPSTGPRLSTWAGLVEADIVEAVRFDPFTGVVEVSYTADYLRVLRFLGDLMVDAGFVGALLIDDPAAMGIVIRRLSAAAPRPGVAEDAQGSWEE